MILFIKTAEALHEALGILWIVKEVFAVKIGAQAHTVLFVQDAKAVITAVKGYFAVKNGCGVGREGTVIAQKRSKEREHGIGLLAAYDVDGFALGEGQSVFAHKIVFVGCEGV